MLLSDGEPPYKETICRRIDGTTGYNIRANDEVIFNNAEKQNLMRKAAESIADFDRALE